MSNNVFRKSIFLGGLLIGLVGFMGCDDFLQPPDIPKENVLEKETTVTPSTVLPSPTSTIQTQITENEPTKTITQPKQQKEMEQSSINPTNPTSTPQQKKEVTPKDDNCLSVKDFMQPSSYKVENVTDGFFYKAVEDKIVRLVNEYRKENGVGALDNNEKLRASARYKSNSMLQLNYFSHENPQLNNNKALYLMETVYGINATWYGENIAYGENIRDSIDTIAQRIFNQWKASEGHRLNMIRKEFTCIGVGVVRLESSPSESKYYATQHFCDDIKN